MKLRVPKAALCGLCAPPCPLCFQLLLLLLPLQFLFLLPLQFLFLLPLPFLFLLPLQFLLLFAVAVPLRPSAPSAVNALTDPARQSRESTHTAPTSTRRSHWDYPIRTAGDPPVGDACSAS